MLEGNVRRTDDLCLIDKSAEQSLACCRTLRSSFCDVVRVRTVEKYAHADCSAGNVADEVLARIPGRFRNVEPVPRAIPTRYPSSVSDRRNSMQRQLVVLMNSSGLRTHCCSAGPTSRKRLVLYYNAITHKNRLNTGACHLSCRRAIWILLSPMKSPCSLSAVWGEDDGRSTCLKDVI